MKKVLGTIMLLSLVALQAAGVDYNLVKCYGCHGHSFEKKALNKSSIVQDMNATQIEFALNGYKDGSYNKAGLGALMKGQISKFSPEEIKAMSIRIKELTIKE